MTTPLIIYLYHHSHFNSSLFHHIIMTVVSHTPRKKRPKTHRYKADTVKKTAFYKAVDTWGLKLLKLVFEDEGVPKSTADNWLT